MTENIKDTYPIVIERYCYWPAVSHIWTFAFLSWINIIKLLYFNGTIFDVYSTPTVGIVLVGTFSLE